MFCPTARFSKHTTWQTKGHLDSSAALEVLSHGRLKSSRLNLTWTARTQTGPSVQRHGSSHQAGLDVPLRKQAGEPKGGPTATSEALMPIPPLMEVASSPPNVSTWPTNPPPMNVSKYSDSNVTKRESPMARIGRRWGEDRAKFRELCGLLLPRDRGAEGARPKWE